MVSSLTEGNTTNHIALLQNIGVLRDQDLKLRIAAIAVRESLRNEPALVSQMIVGEADMALKSVAAKEIVIFSSMNGDLAAARSWLIHVTDAEIREELSGLIRRASAPSKGRAPTIV